MNDAKTITQRLTDLGLSSDQASIYVLLSSAGSLSAKEVAEQSGIVVNSIYRLIASLEGMGLIRTLETTPKKFQPVEPKIALSKLVEEKTALLNNTSNRVIEALSSAETKQETTMSTLTGQKELFDDFVRRTKKAKTEVLVISIGEEVPDSIWGSVQDAISRGVKARFIFHQNTKENVLLIKRWQSMGVDVRHVPNEGYHLFVFDDSAAVMSASNPKNTKERTGVVIINKSLIAAMRVYFEQQWELGRKAGNNSN